MGDLGIGIVVISMLISIGIIVGLLRSGAKSESWPVFFQKFWINAFIYTAFILGLRGAATGFHSSAQFIGALVAGFLMPFIFMLLGKAGRHAVFGIRNLFSESRDPDTGQVIKTTLRQKWMRLSKDWRRIFFVGPIWIASWLIYSSVTDFHGSYRYRADDFAFDLMILLGPLFLLWAATIGYKHFVGDGD